MTIFNSDNVRSPVKEPLFRKKHKFGMEISVGNAHRHSL